MPGKEMPIPMDDRVDPETYVTPDTQFDDYANADVDCPNCGNPESRCTCEPDDDVDDGEVEETEEERKAREQREAEEKKGEDMAKDIKDGSVEDRGIDPEDMWMSGKATKEEMEKGEDMARDVELEEERKATEADREAGRF